LGLKKPLFDRSLNLYFPNARFATYRGRYQLMKLH
jgi:hypothetical protein